ncbi:MAG TPA: PA2779 family protein [Terriglobales bacterium]|jgi:hypothetical protein
MTFDLGKCARAVIASVLAMAFAVPCGFAQEHVVSPSDLQKEVVNASQTRQQNIDKVQNLLSTEVGRQAMQKVHANPEQVKKAVSTLNDQELAQLAAKADKAQADFAAGTLDTRDLLIIIIAILAVILIIVAVS